MFHRMSIVMFALIPDRPCLTVDSMASIRFSVWSRVSLVHPRDAKDAESLMTTPYVGDDGGWRREEGGGRIYR